MIKSIQAFMEKSGFLLRRKNKWTDIPLSVVPAIVDHRCAKLGRPCVAVQIGANDGQTHDHMAWCLKYLDVQALLVEPMPVPYEKLRARWGGHSNIKLDQCAVSDEDGLLTLHVFAQCGHAALASSRVASFSREHVESHRESHGRFDSQIMQLDVPAKRFSTRALAKARSYSWDDATEKLEQSMAALVHRSPVSRVRTESSVR